MSVFTPPPSRTASPHYYSLELLLWLLSLTLVRRLIIHRRFCQVNLERLLARNCTAQVRNRTETENPRYSIR